MKLLMILKDGWMSFSHALGRVMSFIILTVLWVVAIGIYAIIWKLVHLTKKSPSGSTWVTLAQQESDLRRQF